MTERELAALMSGMHIVLLSLELHEVSGKMRRDIERAIELSRDSDLKRRLVRIFCRESVRVLDSAQAVEEVGRRLYPPQPLPKYYR